MKTKLNINPIPLGLLCSEQMIDVDVLNNKCLTHFFYSNSNRFLSVLLSSLLSRGPRQQTTIKTLNKCVQQYFIESLIRNGQLRNLFSFKHRPIFMNLKWMNRTAVNRLQMIVKFTAKDGKTNYQVLEKLPIIYFNIALSLSLFLLKLLLYVLMTKTRMHEIHMSKVFVN